MRDAFTLIELIFVIVIIGILTAVGINSFNPHYLQNDTSKVLIKLNEVRYKGINYDKSLANSETNTSVGCIDLNKLQSELNHATIELNGAASPICFDIYGRVHNGADDNNATTLSSLLNSDINITLNYNNKSKTVLILHRSGYIVNSL